MDLQTIFYSLGIVFMLLMIFFMVALIVLVVTVANKVKNFRNNVVRNTMSIIGNNRREVMSILGLGLSSLVMSRLRNIFRRK